MGELAGKASEILGGQNRRKLERREKEAVNWGWLESTH
jgi:hypothetical protein